MACNGGGFALGLLVGGVIGAAAGILLAPKPGAETRSELMERGEAWRTRADSMAADMRTRGMQEISDAGKRVGPAVDSLKARGASAAASAREAGTEAIASARSRMGVPTDGATPEPVAATVAVATDGADGASSPESESAPEPKAPETA